MVINNHCNDSFTVIVTLKFLITLMDFGKLKNFSLNLICAFYEARQLHLSISLIPSTDFARREKNELKRKRNITHLKRRHLFSKT